MMIIEAEAEAASSAGNYALRPGEQAAVTTETRADREASVGRLAASLVDTWQQQRGGGEADVHGPNPIDLLQSLMWDVVGHLDPSRRTTELAPPGATTYEDGIVLHAYGVSCAAAVDLRTREGEVIVIRKDHDSPSELPATWLVERANLSNGRRERYMVAHVATRHYDDSDRVELYVPPTSIYDEASNHGFLIIQMSMDGGYAAVGPVVMSRPDYYGRTHVVEGQFTADIGEVYMAIAAVLAARGYGNILPVGGGAAVVYEFPVRPDGKRDKALRPVA